MYRVGVDAHEKGSAIHILDESGKKHNSFTVKGRWPKVVEALKQEPGPMEVCFEASNGYGYFHDTLAPVVRRVVVAHPGQWRLIFRTKRKNDRIDAEKLAKRLFLDTLPEVHVPRPFVRNWRRRLTFRERLVAGRTQVMNRLRGLLKRLGVEAPQALWTRATFCCAACKPCCAKPPPGGNGWLEERALTEAGSENADPVVGAWRIATPSPRLGLLLIMTHGAPQSG